jgi:methyl-accepting chemotaxis protein
MAWWQNLTITWKIGLPILVIALLQVAASFENFSTRSDVTAQSAIIYEKYFNGIDLALNADRDLYQAAIAERTISLAGYDASLYEQYTENVAQVEDRLGQVLALDLDKDINSEVRTFLGAIAQWKSSANQLISQVQQGTISNQAAARQSQNNVASQFGSARDVLDRIGESIKNNSEKRRAAIASAESTASRTSLVFTVLVLALTGLTLWLLPQSIATGLNGLHSAIASISNGRGNLTQRLQVDTNDELGQIAGTFNQFLGTLQDMVRSILSGSKNIISVCRTN